MLVPAPARAAGRTPAALADGLARELADAWIARQLSDGSFADYVDDPYGARRDGYGPAMLGAALLRNGLRTQRPAVVDAGLRAIASAVRARTRPYSVFEALALADAYRLAQRSLTGDRRRRALLPAWRARLRAFDSDLGHGASAAHDAYSNLQLVDLLAALMGRAGGVHSPRPYALLHPPAVVTRIARTLLGHVLPRIAARQRRPSRAGATTVISDPPCNPISYHALSLGMLARSLDVLGERAPRAAREVLVQAARASWAFMSPQGDVAWSGRGQGQSWTLAMTAAGVVAAARQPGVREQERLRFGAVALRALDRLATAYRGASVGLWITPAFAEDPVAAVGGLDWYAAGTSYSGLTLLALEWLAADPAAQLTAPETGIAADVDGGSLLARTGTFATVRRGDVWMAVKQCPAVRDHAIVDHRQDLRYDAGASLVLARGADGTWQPVLRPRPITNRWDAAGPLLHVHGRPARMVGFHTRVGTLGTVLVRARFTTQAGRVLRVADVRFEPTRCGVRIRVAGRAGDVWEHSAFFASVPSRTGDRAVSDGHVVFGAALPATVSVGGFYTSAMDARLVRARLRVPLKRASAVLFEACRF